MLFLISVQDSGLIDMENYRHNDANVTAVQLVDFKAAFTQKVVDEMTSYQIRTRTKLLSSLQRPSLTVTAVDYTVSQKMSLIVNNFNKLETILILFGTLYAETTDF